MVQTANPAPADCTGCSALSFERITAPAAACEKPLAAASRSNILTVSGCM